MDTTLPSGKKIAELKVVDLKKELTERKKSTIGKKSILAERLIEALQDENKHLKEEEMLHQCHHESENVITTPLKSINIIDDPQIRKSSRSERYLRSEDGETKMSSSFLSEDDDPPAVRRSSSIRRSIFRSLGLENDSSLQRVTPAKSEKRISCIALRTRSRSRDRTVSISPERSRILEVFATPKSNGASKSAMRNASFTRSIGKTKTSRRSGSIEPLYSDRQIIRRRSNSVDSARKPPAPPSSAQRHGRGNRFALQHQKLFEKELTLSEHRDRHQRRHIELTSGVSDGLKRLATPKKLASIRVPATVSDDLERNIGFRFNKTANTTNFKFGALNPEDYSNIPKKKPTSVAPDIMSKTTEHHRVDVKTMSKGFTRNMPKSLTYPMDETRLAYLSTPKGKTPIKTPSRQGYVPHSGALTKYIDTSKLNDRELEMAREAGLVRQSSARKTRSQAEKNTMKREELLNIRRKLNL